MFLTRKLKRYLYDNYAKKQEIEHLENRHRALRDNFLKLQHDLNVLCHHFKIRIETENAIPAKRVVKSIEVNHGEGSES